MSASHACSYCRVAPARFRTSNGAALLCSRQCAERLYVGSSVEMLIGHAHATGSAAVTAPTTPKHALATRPPAVTTPVVRPPAGKGPVPPPPPDSRLQPPPASPWYRRHRPYHYRLPPLVAVDPLMPYYWHWLLYRDAAYADEYPVQYVAADSPLMAVLLADAELLADVSPLERFAVAGTDGRLYHALPHGLVEELKWREYLAQQASPASILYPNVPLVQVESAAPVLDVFRRHPQLLAAPLDMHKPTAATSKGHFELPAHLVRAFPLAPQQSPQQFIGAGGRAGDKDTGGDSASSTTTSAQRKRKPEADSTANKQSALRPATSNEPTDDPFQQLPDEAVLAVLAQVPLDETVRLAHVSRRFRALALDEARLQRAVDEYAGEHLVPQLLKAADRVYVHFTRALGYDSGDEHAPLPSGVRELAMLSARVVHPVVGRLRDVLLADDAPWARPQNIMTNYVNTDALARSVDDYTWMLQQIDINFAAAAAAGDEGRAPAAAAFVGARQAERTRRALADLRTLIDVRTWASTDAAQFVMDAAMAGNTDDPADAERALRDRYATLFRENPATGEPAPFDSRLAAGLRVHVALESVRALMDLYDRLEGAGDAMLPARDFIRSIVYIVCMRRYAPADPDSDDDTDTDSAEDRLGEGILRAAIVQGDLAELVALWGDLADRQLADVDTSFSEHAVPCEFLLTECTRTLRYGYDVTYPTRTVQACWQLIPDQYVEHDLCEKRSEALEIATRTLVHEIQHGGKVDARMHQQWAIKLPAAEGGVLEAFLDASLVSHNDIVELMFSMYASIRLSESLQRLTLRAARKPDASAESVGRMWFDIIQHFLMRQVDTRRMIRPARYFGSKRGMVAFIWAHYLPVGGALRERIRALGISTTTIDATQVMGVAMLYGAFTVLNEMVAYLTAREAQPALEMACRYGRVGHQRWERIVLSKQAEDWALPAAWERLLAPLRGDEYSTRSAAVRAPPPICAALSPALLTLLDSLEVQSDVNVSMLPVVGMPQHLLAAAVHLGRDAAVSRLLQAARVAFSVRDMEYALDMALLDENLVCTQRLLLHWPSGVVFPQLTVRIALRLPSLRLAASRKATVLVGRLLKMICEHRAFHKDADHRSALVDFFNEDVRREYAESLEYALLAGALQRQGIVAADYQ